MIKNSTKTITLAVFFTAFMCSGLIINSKEALAVTDIATPVFFEQPPEQQRFQQWFNAKSALEQYKNPSKQFQVTPTEKAGIINKFQNENTYQKEINKVQEKLKIINYFKQ